MGDTYAGGGYYCSVSEHANACLRPGAALFSSWVNLAVLMRYAECVCAAVADDGFMVGECNDMAGGNDVVYAYEGCAVLVGYHR